MTSRSRARSHRSCQEPEDGIALMVVMVVFVVLYLVVFQLHFSTKMEENMAQIRYGESESAVAVQSAVLFAMAHLVEDLRSDMTTEASQGAGAAAAPAGGVPKVSDPKLEGEGPAGGGSFANLSPAGMGGGGSKPHDALNDRLFSPNIQSVGQVSVKITMVDGERRLDLNRLFDYVRLPDEEVTPAAGAAGAGAVPLSDEELVGAVAGKTEEEAGQSLRQKLLDKAKTKRVGSKSKEAQAAGGAGAAEGEAGAAAGEAGLDPATGTTAESAMSDYDPIVFELPTPDRIEMTRQMVERAVVMMFSVNENEYGYRYSQRFDARSIASAIVDYVLARRQSPVQNRIYLVSELLNLPEVTPEVYYGPAPRVLPDEPYPVGNGFELRVDEFGDIVPEYVEYQADEAYEEDQRRLLDDLQQQFGQYADLGGLGLGLDSRLANPITRGMKELPVALDQDGFEYVPEVPKVIGLKDIFTTYSSGKINLNTAPVPVVFGLLLSLSDEDANQVALDLKDYRLRFQEEVEETGGVADVAAGDETPELGQPKRKKRDPEEEKKAASGALPGAAAGALGAAGIDPSLLEYEGSSYQDPELNYLTDLPQIELIDGSDGSPYDRLSSKEAGIQKVSEEQEDSLLRRVVHDLEKVAVFSSTYFNVELKSKPKDGRGVKTGYLTIRRDGKAGTIDVLMWKNQER